MSTVVRADEAEASVSWAPATFKPDRRLDHGVCTLSRANLSLGKRRHVPVVFPNLDADVNPTSKRFTKEHQQCHTSQMGIFSVDDLVSGIMRVSKKFTQIIAEENEMYYDAKTDFMSVNNEIAYSEEAICRHGIRPARCASPRSGMDVNTVLTTSSAPAPMMLKDIQTFDDGPDVAAVSSAFLDAAEDEALTPPLPSLHAFVVFDTGLVIVDEEAVSDILSSPLPMGVPYYDDVLPCWRWRVLY
ncbi:hypothetical protein BKA93DRAFT_752540 [Sparassis latifolia]